MQQRVYAISSIDFDKPLPIDFTSELRNHLFQIRELDTQSRVQRFSTQASGYSIRGGGGIFVDGDVTSLESGSIGKSRKVSACVIVSVAPFLIEFVALLENCRNFSAHYYDESVNLLKKSFDKARESTFAQIGNQRIKQHKASRQV